MNEELGYQESHFVILLKIGVYFVLNTLGIATGLYGYLVKPFATTRLLVGIGSCVYLLAAGIWAVVLQYCICPTVYRGRNRQTGKTLWLRSSMRHPQAVYVLEVLNPMTSAKPTVNATIEIPVGHWIDEDGKIVAETVVRELKTKVASKCAMLTKAD